MTWWMARQARWRGVVWCADQAMGCCGCGGSGSCGSVGGWHSKLGGVAWCGVLIKPWVAVDVVGRVRVAVLVDGDLRV
nr:hypothetical protein CFP56_07077 [Quercus suber]